MKIKISYGAGERLAAAVAMGALKKLFPKATVKESDAAPARRVVYMTIKEPV